METSTMKYPFGRCISCGKEFNSELRNEYGIEYCPWCGDIILDYFHDVNPPDGLLIKSDPDRFIYCEDCGQRIYERTADKQGGMWCQSIDGKSPGICSGPCERELCWNCGDWDVNGECEQCRNSLCGQCPNHKAIEVCQKCDHLQERKKWADWKKTDSQSDKEKKGEKDA